MYPALSATTRFKNAFSGANSYLKHPLPCPILTHRNPFNLTKMAPEMAPEKGKHPHTALSAAKVRTETRPGIYADGNGLYLQVHPTGTKRWVKRITLNGRRRKLGLGGWPDVSLAEARQQAVVNLGTVRAGGDPLAEKRRQSMPTFAEAAGRVIAFRRPTWKNPKHAAQWESTLKTYAYPVIGPVLVGEVTSADVLRVLIPIWTAEPETASRVRQRIGAVLDWAIAQGYRNDNPAGAISAALPRLRRGPRHYPALHYSEVAGAVRQVWDSDAALVTKLAFEFLV